jgi:hypothetical protein
MNDKIFASALACFFFAAWNNPFCAASARYLFWQSGRSLRHGFSSFLSIRPIHIRRQKNDPGNRQSDPEETVAERME